MSGRRKRFWSDDEQRSICYQTTAAGVSVAQVARRYALNANMIFKWLRDPRYAPEADRSVERPASDAACFLPVEIVDQVLKDDPVPDVDPAPSNCRIEIDILGGHRLRISGAYDPEALARLIRCLTG